MSLGGTMQLLLEVQFLQTALAALLTPATPPMDPPIATLFDNLVQVVPPYVA